MKPSELKKLMMESLDGKSDSRVSSGKLEEAGVTYDFRSGFADRVLGRIFPASEAVVREMEFVRSLRFVFTRVALTGVAAIILLLITLFIAEGSLSFDSFLGISNSYDEGIVYLLTGN